MIYEGGSFSYRQALWVVKNIANENSCGLKSGTCHGFTRMIKNRSTEVKRRSNLMHLRICDTERVDINL